MLKYQIFLLYTVRLEKKGDQVKKLAKHTIKAVIWLAFLAIAAGAIYWYLQHEKFYPSTDDAYVQANVVQIAAQVSGPVDQIGVQDHQDVKAGQQLFTIDRKPFAIAVQQAEANLQNTVQQVGAEREAVVSALAIVQERQAQLTEAQKNANRILTLVKENLMAKSQGDQVTSQLQVAEAALNAARSQLAEAQQKFGVPGKANAQIRAAQAALDQAKLNLAHTQISAPADGQIVNFTLRAGSMVTAEQPIFSLIESKNWWVSANYKETDLNRIRPGQLATIKVDLYPDYTFVGQVVSISGGSGAAFSLLPPENATGNWVKVTQRFPVRVKFFNPNPKYPLRMGASATVTIDTKGDQHK